MTAGWKRDGAAGPAARGAGSHRGRRGRKTIVTAGLLVSLVSGGCIFSTRAPHDPAGQEVPWISPDRTEAVLENIRVTFNAKSVENYNRSMADDFTFKPADPDDIATGGGCFDGWNKEREVQVFSDILTKTSTQKITFTWGTHGEPESVPERPEDRLYRLLPYKMVFAPPADTTFEGKANLYMRAVNGLWALYRWEDVRVSAETMTLGRLRCSGRVQP